MSTVYTPLNEGERNFLALYGLKVTRFNDWMVIARYEYAPAGFLFDRAEPFELWAKRIR